MIADNKASSVVHFTKTIGYHLITADHLITIDVERQLSSNICFNDNQIIIQFVLHMHLLYMSSAHLDYPLTNKEV